jgi:hypothetical protein
MRNSLENLLRNRKGHVLLTNMEYIERILTLR